MSKAQRLKTARRERRRQAQEAIAAIRQESVVTGAASWFGYPVVYLLLAVAVGDYFTFADSDIWGHIRWARKCSRPGI